MKTLLLSAGTALALLLAAASPAEAGTTLMQIRAAGSLSCGVVTEETDYTKFDTHGGLDDLGAELCKAFAIAALGENAKARVTGHPDEETAFKALAAGHTDVLAAASPTSRYAALYGLSFAPPVFFDGQGIMVDKAANIHSLRDLAGRLVCGIGGTDAEAQLRAATQAAGIKINPYPFEEMGEMDAALVTGHCAAQTGDISQLAEERAAFHARKADFIILPDLITLDPAAPAVRQDDPAWAAIVTLVVETLIQAEASGVTKANVDAMRHSEDPTIQRLLGADRTASHALGLADDWPATVLKALGNYGEIYARTLGPGTEYDLPRGRNALWTQGGLLYALPFR